MSGPTDDDVSTSPLDLTQRAQSLPRESHRRMRIPGLYSVAWHTVVSLARTNINRIDR